MSPKDLLTRVTYLWFSRSKLQPFAVYLQDNLGQELCHCLSPTPTRLRMFYVDRRRQRQAQWFNAETHP